MKEKNYKTSEEQRAKMLAYYYKNRERLLEYQRQIRLKQQQQSVQHETLLSMYYDWQEYILKKLKTKLPKWIRVGLEHQWLNNQNKIRELNQYEQRRKKELER